ncbi:hypothetical protein ACLOJK_010554 [Asimina triloba]
MRHRFANFVCLGRRSGGSNVAKKDGCIGERRTGEVIKLELAGGKPSHCYNVSQVTPNKKRMMESSMGIPMTFSCCLNPSVLSLAL